ISKRWLLFPDQDQLDSRHVVQNTASINPDNFISLKSKLYMVETRYMGFLDEQQKSVLLNQLDDILTVPEVKLSDIKVPEKIIEKGRPSGTK
ncbi:8276_t:CDS:1, partial [Racocetra persica]